MSVEEEKVDYTKDEGIHFDIQGEYFKRTSRDNTETGVEQLQPRMEGNSYKSVSRKLQFLMKNYTCMNKTNIKRIKESEVMTNINTHSYMQAEVKVIFTQIHSKKGINMFG